MQHAAGDAVATQAGLPSRCNESTISSLARSGRRLAAAWSSSRSGKHVMA